MSSTVFIRLQFARIANYVPSSSALWTQTFLGTDGMEHVFSKINFSVHLFALFVYGSAHHIVIETPLTDRPNNSEDDWAILSLAHYGNNLSQGKETGPSIPVRTGFVPQF